MAPGALRMAHYFNGAESRDSKRRWRACRALGAVMTAARQNRRPACPSSAAPIPSGGKAIAVYQIVAAIVLGARLIHRACGVLSALFACGISRACVAKSARESGGRQIKSTYKRRLAEMKTL